MESDKTQSGKFKELALEVGAQEDEARWEERLQKLATVKPSPGKPE